MHVPDPRDEPLEALDLRDELGAEGGVAAHDGELLVRERALLAQQLVGDGDLADVVEDRGDPQLREPRLRPAQPAPDRDGEVRDGLRVRVGAAVDTAVDGRRQRGRPGELAPARGHLDGRAPVLDRVEPDVGLVVELLALAARRPAGRRRPATPAHGSPARRAAAAPRVRLARARAPDEHRELVAAQPSDVPRSPSVAREGRDDPAQVLVAGGVAVEVVELLEAVEVDEEVAERLSRALGAAQLDREAPPRSRVGSGTP